MRVLYLSDRLSTRGGADHHLLQLVSWACGAGHEVTVACGRVAPDVDLPCRATAVRVRGLAAAGASEAGCDRLADLLSVAEVVHLQNVMNPVAIHAASSTGRAIATVQDHRVLCPGPGKTLPTGARCHQPMGEAVCTACLPEPDYRRRMLRRTRARRDALRGARLVVLSRYMAEELEAAGLPGAEVIPPWVETGRPRRSAGEAFLLGGRLVHHKGPADALGAWRFSGRPLPLRVAGAGPLECEVEGAERLGWLGRAELAGELRRARALLFPARWQEPFGILGVEALAQGTPVVVADVGGTREWSGAGCVRVPAGDVAAMAAAVGQLAADEGFALRLGEQGRRRVGDRFGRRAVSALLGALYTGVGRG